MIRVLIAEDSTTCLELLTALVESDPELHVIGHAANGVQALKLTHELHPDVIVMDIHMPVMDGFEATRHIMIETPTPIVIVSAVVNVREVAVSMQALRLGALTVLPKPAFVEGAAFDDHARQFAGTVRAMSGVRVVQRWRSSKPPAMPALNAAVIGAPSVVAIAASTGGPGALHRLLVELKAEFPVPILVVQHIALGFVRGLVSWLNDSSALTVKVAESGDKLRPGCALVAPDDVHLGLSDRDTVELSQRPAVAGFRPSGTFLFDSVARQHRSGTLAVVLTGMGDDGVVGLRTVREMGGRIWAQDAQSSVVFGMPGAAAAAGLADVMVPIDLLAARLQRIASERFDRNPYVKKTS